MKTVLATEVVDGIGRIYVNSGHEIHEAVPKVTHAEAFEATELPRQVKDQFFGSPNQLNMYLSAVLEVMLYSGKNIFEVMGLMKVEVPVQKEWEEFKPDPNQHESLCGFYEKTDAFIYDGMANHALPTTMATLGEVLRVCLHFGLKEVLDWGAGIGTLNILMNSYGIKGTHVDLPGKTLEYARWRYRLRGMDVEVVSLPHSFETESVDGIVCLEVVEHVKDPLNMLSDLYRIIRPGGILICSESFGHPEFSSHLEENVKYAGDTFISEMARIGFQLLPDFSKFHPKTYQKV
ncbi:MAG: methyltransferase domain-containing protein [Deltaproteobacteria bacterium]|nr:methyltransferase domain-containing protein [Deltaproteobacteria bacterium]